MSRRSQVHDAADLNRAGPVDQDAGRWHTTTSGGSVLSLLWLLIIGLLAGLLARLIVPGKDSMSLIATLVVGVAGSLVGGLLLGLVTGGLRDRGRRLAARLCGRWTMSAPVRSNGSLVKQLNHCRRPECRPASRFPDSASAAR